MTPSRLFVVFLSLCIPHVVLSCNIDILLDASVTFPMDPLENNQPVNFELRITNAGPAASTVYPIFHGCSKESGDIPAYAFYVASNNPAYETLTVTLTNSSMGEDGEGCGEFTISTLEESPLPIFAPGTWFSIIFNSTSAAVFSNSTEYVSRGWLDLTPLTDMGLFDTNETNHEEASVTIALADC